VLCPALELSLLLSHQVQRYEIEHRVHPLPQQLPEGRRVS